MPAGLRLLIALNTLEAGYKLKWASLYQILYSVRKKHARKTRGDIQMSKRIQTRANTAVVIFTALIDDDFQMLNSFLEPYDETQLKRSLTSNIDKNYMFKSITQYLDLTISGLILAQRLYAYLVNNDQLQQD